MLLHSQCLKEVLFTPLHSETFSLSTDFKLRLVLSPRSHCYMWGTTHKDSVRGLVSKVFIFSLLTRMKRLGRSLNLGTLLKSGYMRSYLFIGGALTRSSN